MKTELSTIALATILGNTAAFAQGSLTPPGAPAPTFKTLAQIEPRTAITNTGSVTISQPGSYYLTGNIAVTNGDAITITTNNVTLDLNGFTVSSTEVSPAGTGIFLNGSRANIAILNGFITGGVTNSGGIYGGSGFGYGIWFLGSLRSVRVVGVTVSGCLYNGIYVGNNSAVVESCAVSVIGGVGILADSVSRSTARQCGSIGIYAISAADCVGEAVGSGYGVQADTVHNCFGSSSSGYGITATIAENCDGSSGSSLGVYAYNLAQNCHGYSGSDTGLEALNVANGCYGESSSPSAPALYAGGTANICSGRNYGGGPAIQTCIAIGCTTFGGAVNASCSKWLGTP